MSYIKGHPRRTWTRERGQYEAMFRAVSRFRRPTFAQWVRAGKPARMTRPDPVPASKRKRRVRFDIGSY